MSERRSNTICAVVERPDYYCGDDLVHLELVLVRFGVAHLIPVAAFASFSITGVAQELLHQSQHCEKLQTTEGDEQPESSAAVHQRRLGITGQLSPFTKSWPIFEILSPFSSAFISVQTTKYLLHLAPQLEGAKYVRVKC